MDKYILSYLNSSKGSLYTMYHVLDYITWHEVKAGSNLNHTPTPQDEGNDEITSEAT
jgi:hypothetical protein